MNYKECKIWYIPDKRWWELWKQNRYLQEGEDYEVTNGRFVLKTIIKGQTEIHAPKFNNSTGEKDYVKLY